MAQAKFEGMYAGIDTNATLLRKHPSGHLQWPDVFTNYYSWSNIKKTRYLAADAFIGREFLIIAMHASGFRNSLADDSNAEWLSLRTLVRDNRFSLRMFLLMRRVQYAFYYDRSPLADATILGPVVPYDMYSKSNIRHPHELYLDQNGEIKRCEFTNTATKLKKPIVNQTENKYDPTLFTLVAKHPNWPADWPYPFNPQYGAESEAGPWNTCDGFSALVVPNKAYHASLRTSNQAICECNPDACIAPPIVEIVQYPNANYEKLNRGVRALSNIDPFDFIGEYVGEMYPLGLENDCGDGTYLCSFDGPYIAQADDYSDRTSVVAAGYWGNWTRFLNHAKDNNKDVDFRSRVFANKQRLIVIPRRKIRFGKEILMSYGANYFTGPDAEKAVAKEKQAEREERERGADVLFRTRASQAVRTQPYPTPNPPPSAEPSGGMATRNRKGGVRDTRNSGTRGGAAAL